MKLTATAKNVRISPRKVLLVAQAVKNKSVDQALVSLMVLQKRAALPIGKTLNSAIANAVNNAQVKREALTISAINVVAGQSLKRFRPSTRGRVHPYKKRGSHITIILETKGNN